MTKGIVTLRVGALALCLLRGCYFGGQGEPLRRGLMARSPFRSRRQLGQTSFSFCPTPILQFPCIYQIQTRAYEKHDMERSNISESPTHDEIAARAKEIYIQSGGLPGRDVENWLAAEKELSNRARSKAVPSTGDTAGKSSVKAKPSGRTRNRAQLLGTP